MSENMIHESTRDLKYSVEFIDSSSAAAMTQTSLGHLLSVFLDFPPMVYSMVREFFLGMSLISPNFQWSDFDPGVSLAKNSTMSPTFTGSVLSHFAGLGIRRWM